MIIVTEKITRDELREMAAGSFGDMVKGVVDIEKEVVAVEADLHADLEALLLEGGSSQKNLWGINLFPDAPCEDFVEFDSMINLKPSCGNMSRGVDDERVRMKIIEVVNKRVPE